MNVPQFHLHAANASPEPRTCDTRYARRRTSFSDHVFLVLLVVTNELHWLSIKGDLPLHRNRPGLCVGAWIVYCDFHIEVAVVFPSKAFYQPPFWCDRASNIVEPGVVF